MVGNLPDVECESSSEEEEEEEEEVPVVRTNTTAPAKTRYCECVTFTNRVRWGDAG